MPRFAAPEAYGKKKNESMANLVKAVEEKVIKAAARKERERASRRKRKRKGGGQLVSVVEAELDTAGWTLILTTIVGVFIALAEALDLDVQFAGPRSPPAPSLLASLHCSPSRVCRTLWHLAQRDTHEQPWIGTLSLTHTRSRACSHNVDCHSTTHALAGPRRYLGDAVHDGDEIPCGKTGQR